MNDLVKESNQIAKRSALLEHLAAIRKRVRTRSMGLVVRRCHPRPVEGLMLKVRVYSYSDGRSQPFTAYAANGKSPYDWRTGLTEIEALTRLRASYISWQNLPFTVTRIEK